MTSYTISDLERFIDGECSADESAGISAELEKDPALASEFYRLQEVDRLVYGLARETSAPNALRASVDARFGPGGGKAGAGRDGLRARVPVNARRRGFLIGAGGLLAATVAGVAVYPGLDRLGGGRIDPVSTIFRDFETFLLKDRAIDVVETDMVRLAGWFSDRLPFSLPPIASDGAGTRLVGGRLCWLLDRRLAALSYETDEGPLVVYVMSARGIDVPAGRENSNIGTHVSWHRSEGSTSVMWTSGDLFVAMVSTQELHKLMAIAGKLVG